MNNIEILEERINFCKNNTECREELKQCFGCAFEIEEIQAIENLIKENKELEEKLNDRVDIKQTANSISFTMPSKVVEKYMEVLDETALEIENKRLKKLIEKTEKDYIPKSKVKELGEKVHNKLDNNAITRGYQIIIDEMFSKLLEEEEGE